ncbi:hypothetical protein H5410_036880 [Solanum commersonii]|uniref:Uncharacterized protein n=1 Tax=Solanum commersonii TaxID=4109 RepID=A0A9J5Y7V7_SOLCO|nr:hypothetical protein H5410_036880 [Solanum commersonii]
MYRYRYTGIKLWYRSVPCTGSRCPVPSRILPDRNEPEWYRNGTGTVPDRYRYNPVRCPALVSMCWVDYTYWMGRFYLGVNIYVLYDGASNFHCFMAHVHLDNSNYIIIGIQVRV